MGILGGAGLASVVGCVPSSPASLESEDPQARTRALVKASQQNDRSAIPDLIGLLASDDPAERMLAIRSLERMTGQTLGYDFAAEQWRRDEAIRKWVAWWKDEGGDVSRIAGETASD